MNADSLLQSIFQPDANIDVRQLFEQRILEYGVSKTKILKLLNIDKDVFEEILNGVAKQPNLIHIIKIADFLRLDLSTFIKAIMANQSVENIASIENSRKVTFLLRNFDVKVLTKLGFFEDDDDVNVLVKRVLDFFGYQSISDFEEHLEEPLYSRTKRNFSDKMKDFWIKSAYQTFKSIDNPNAYDRNRLKDIIVKIKPYSQDIDNGLYTVCRALYNIGVTVIFQDYLTTMQVRGATFILNDKPCIVITDFNKRYPTIWFTLLHELHHVLYDFELIKSNSYHLTGDADLFLIEEKADEFAREFFLSEEKFHYIKRYITNAYMVQKFAKEHEIHESFVYSFFTWYQEKLYDKNFHGAFKQFYPSYKTALIKLSPVSWDADSIRSASDKIKSVFELQ